MADGTLTLLFITITGFTILALTLLYLYVNVVGEWRLGSAFEPSEHSQASLEPGSSSDVQQEPLDWNLYVNDLIEVIPTCVKSCVFNRLNVLRCAHSDYACLCRQFHRLEDVGVDNGNSDEESFSQCVGMCEDNNVLHVLPAQVLQLCDTLQEKVDLPDFMLKNLILYGRAGVGSSSAFIVPVPTSSTPIPVPASTPITTQTPVTVTVTPKASTTTLPPATSTGYYSGSSYTIFFTTTLYTTLSAGEVASTSYYTGAYGLTVYIGITDGATGVSSSTNKAKTQSTTSKSTTQTSSTQPNVASATATVTRSSVASYKSPSRLSSTAKIGLGVAIPLLVIFIALIVFLLWRRKKKAQPVPEIDRPFPELPGATSTRNELPSGTQKWPDEKGPAISHVHGMNQQQQQQEHHWQQYGVGNAYIHDSKGDSQLPEPVPIPVHELRADPHPEPQLQPPPVIHELPQEVQSPRYELTDTGIPHEVEIPTSPTLPLTVPKPVAFTSHPPPLSVTTPVHRQDRFPAPWETSPGEDSFTTGSAAQPLAEMAAGASPQDESEIREMEQEIERVREEQERLQRLQDLRVREEELRKEIEAKRRGGSC